MCGQISAIWMLETFLRMRNDHDLGSVHHKRIRHPQSGAGQVAAARLGSCRNRVARARSRSRIRSIVRGRPQDRPRVRRRGAASAYASGSGRSRSADRAPARRAAEAEYRMTARSHRLVASGRSRRCDNGPGAASAPLVLALALALLALNRVVRTGKTGAGKPGAGKTGPEDRSRDRGPCARSAEEVALMPRSSGTRRSATTKPGG